MMRISRRSSKRRGSTIVEFVFVALELFFVMFACLEFGRMLLVYTNVANAAKIGLRYAIVHGQERSGAVDTKDGPWTKTSVCAAVVDFAKSGLLNAGLLSAGCGQTTGTRIQVTPTTVGFAGSVVQVTVVYNYDPFFTAFPGLNVPLGSTAQGIVTF
ncbi:MAG TPA: TadE/TadG family type IV pilus assembly protein [Bryobacterales bacterium]|nr:TadE/TadG family type IV pilus assembly protein [Bryobacterales bacterium]